MYRNIFIPYIIWDDDEDDEEEEEGEEDNDYMESTCQR